MHASNFQFSAAHLFYAFVLHAAAASLFGPAGFLVALFVLLLWWQIIAGAQRELDGPQPELAPHNRAAVSRLELVAVLLFSSMLVGLLLPASSDYDPMQQARSSMRQVASAIASYEAKNHCQLPSIVCDSSGRPMHSWRALILQELGEDNLADSYRLDEPWDSQNNLQLSHCRPWHYRSFYPSTRAEEASPNCSQTHLACLSQRGQTILVEHEDQDTNWLAPNAFSLQQWKSSNTLPTEDRGFWDHGILSSNYRGRLAAIGDSAFAVHPGADLDSVITTNTLQLGHPVRVHHFGTLLRIVFFAAVAIYPIRWLRKVRSS